MSHKQIGFIGAGNMTRSIIAGLIESGFPASNIVASNRSVEKLMALQEDFGVNITTDNDSIIGFADIIVLSVKPQIMESVVAKFDDDLIDDSKVFMSIAAGLTIDRLSQMLPSAHKWVRAMPNTPSAVGMGMTGLIANPKINAEERDLCNTLMAAVGETLWVDDESKIDGVIAAAGSAPAYFFLFLEAMQAEAEDMGFSHDDARLLVQQAMLGAANMVAKNPDIEIATLRENVTSKGGTTAAALQSFNEGGLDELVSRSMKSAVARAKEMSEQL